MLSTKSTYAFRGIITVTRDFLYTSLANFSTGSTAFFVKNDEDLYTKCTPLFVVKVHIALQNKQNLTQLQQTIKPQMLLISVYYQTTAQ